MGKLRKLRKAIEKEPEKWRGYRVRATRIGGKWCPTRWWNPWNPRRYGAFIDHVLTEVGNADVESGTIGDLAKSQTVPRNGRCG